MGDWKMPGPDLDDPFSQKGLWHTLARIVKRKQPHICTQVNAAGCRSAGPVCSGHFPQPIHTDKMPKEDETERCYRYYCPGPEHRNIGPYIPVSRGGLFLKLPRI